MKFGTLALFLAGSALAAISALAAPAPAAAPNAAAAAAPAPVAEQLNDRMIQFGNFQFLWEGNGGGVLGALVDVDGLNPSPFIMADADTLSLSLNIKYIPAVGGASGGAAQIFVNTYATAGGAKTMHCIDAGHNPGPGTQLSLQPCATTPGQNWVIDDQSGYFHHGVVDNGRVYLANTGLCWDVTAGDVKLPMQVWWCATGNPNQVFRVSLTT